MLSIICIPYHVIQEGERYRVIEDTHTHTHTHTHIHTYKYVYIRVNVYVRVSARRWHRDTQSVVVSFTRDKNVSANLNVFL